MRRYVGVAGPCVSSLSHGASLSPKRATQNRGTRLYPPLCESGRTLCILVLPRGSTSSLDSAALALSLCKEQRDREQVTVRSRMQTGNRNALGCITQPTGCIVNYAGTMVQPFGCIHGCMVQPFGCTGGCIENRMPA